MTAVQRFGSFVNANLHFHTLIPDGCGSSGTALDGSNLDHLTNLSVGRSRGSGLGTSPSA